MIANKHLMAIALGVCLLGLSAPDSQTATNVSEPLTVYDEVTGTLTIDVTQSTEGTIPY